MMAESLIPGEQKIFFDFYGVTVGLSSVSAEPMEDIRRDFAWFEDKKAVREPQIELEIVFSAPPWKKFGFASADEKKGLRVREKESVRMIGYDEQALSVYDYKTEHGTVYAADLDLIHETVYILLLSRVGFLLDQKGLHRVHALSFISEGKTHLVMLPVGGGKTTLALRLLSLSGVQLLSEDTPLVDRDGNLWPFPVRIGVAGDEFLPAFRPECQRRFSRRQRGAKILIDVECFPGRWAEKKAYPPDFIWFGGKQFNTAGHVKKAFRWQVLMVLVMNLVVGWGVPQGKEHVLRRNIFVWGPLVFIAGRRFFASLMLVHKCRHVGRVVLGSSAEQNIEMFQSGF